MNIKNIFINVLFTAVTVGIIILIIAIVLEKLSIQYNNSQLTYDKCCGGMPCSDTYYDEESKECKFTTPISFQNLSWWSVVIVIGVATLILFVLTKLIPIGTFPNGVPGEERI